MTKMYETCDVLFQMKTEREANLEDKIAEFPGKAQSPTFGLRAKKICHF